MSTIWMPYSVEARARRFSLARRRAAEQAFVAEQPLADPLDSLVDHAVSSAARNVASAGSTAATLTTPAASSLHIDHVDEVFDGHGADDRREPAVDERAEDLLRLFGRANRPDEPVGGLRVGNLPDDGRIDRERLIDGLLNDIADDRG